MGLAVGQRMGGHENPFARYVEECGGVDYLEQLQSNQAIPDEIYDKAASIIKVYFNGEEMNDLFRTNNDEQQNMNNMNNQSNMSLNNNMNINNNNNNSNQQFNF